MSKILAAFVCVASFCVSFTSFAAKPPAEKQPFKQLIVFGDSYSDSGAGYVDADSPMTAVAVLAQKAKTPFTYAGDPKATPDEGLNYAVSAAQTGLGAARRYPHGEVLYYGMRNQVDDFIKGVKDGKIRFSPTDTLFFIAGGLNDGRLQNETSVANLEGEIESLYAIGARRFSVAILPTAIRGFHAVGVKLNPSLEKIPDEMKQKYPDMKIERSDWGVFFDRVYDHAADYGLDTTGFCAGRLLHNEDPAPCIHPETHYFYHESHPSAATHKAVGEMLYQEALARKD